MSESTQDKIIHFAKQCFFQHGFQKTTMTLVSEYSGFSRVTVHKHFKSKEQLFLAVIGSEMTMKFIRAEAAIDDKAEAWENIENYLLSIASTIFDNIQNEYILQDLHHAFNTIAEEVKKQSQTRVIQFIKDQIQQGIANKQLDLTHCKMDGQTLSTLVDACFSGIIMNSPLEQMKPQLHNLIRLMKLATEAK